MEATAISRETLPDGSVRLGTKSGAFVYRRLKPGKLLITISGNDKGQFGTATLDEIRMEILRQKPVELFIDARDAQNVAVSVSEEWTQFFSTNRENLSRVSVLVGSKVVSLTVAIAQHLSRTGNLIQIYSAPEVFDKLVEAALAGR